MTHKDRERIRDKLADDVDDWIAAGNEIQFCDSSWNASHSDYNEINRKRYSLRRAITAEIKTR